MSSKSQSLRVMSRGLLSAILSVCLLFVALRLRKDNSIFSIEESPPFQNLLKCAESQEVGHCLPKYRGALLLQAKSNLSGLSYQVASLCLHQVVESPSRETKFMLEVQKCFHLAEKVNDVSFSHPKMFALSSFAATCLVSLIPLGGHMLSVFLAERVVFNLPNRNTLLGTTKRLISAVFDVAGQVIETEMQGERELIGQPINDSSVIHGGPKHVRGERAVGANSAGEAPKKQCGPRLVTEVAAISNRAMRQDASLPRELSAEICPSSNMFTPRRQGNSASIIFPTAKEVMLDCAPFSNVLGKQNGRTSEPPTAVSSTHDVHSCYSSNILNSSEPQADHVSTENQSVEGTKQNKPSFDISTEIGRAQMKQYLLSKMKQRTPSVSSQKHLEGSGLAHAARRVPHVYAPTRGWGKG